MQHDSASISVGSLNVENLKFTSVLTELARPLWMINWQRCPQKCGWLGTWILLPTSPSWHSQRFDFLQPVGFQRFNFFWIGFPKPFFTHFV